jgi:hypothetical protein
MSTKPIGCWPGSKRDDRLGFAWLPPVSVLELPFGPADRRTYCWCLARKRCQEMRPTAAEQSTPATTMRISDSTAPNPPE